jgi:hypothetical protein
LATAKEALGTGGSGGLGRFFGVRGHVAHGGRFALRAVLDAEGHRALCAEDSHESRLQLGTVVTLDPHLINAVGNNERDLARIDVGQAQCGKPTIENAIAQFAPQGR